MYKVPLLLLLLVSNYTFSSEYLEKALTAYQKQNIEAAYIHLKNALQENDENLPAKVLMGRVLLDKGLYIDGIQEFNDALALGADPNQFIFEQVRAMLLVGRYQSIIDLLESLKLQRDVEVKTFLIKSNAYIALDKESEALEPLLRAQSMAPNDISVLSSLVNYHINQRQFSRADEGLNELRKLAPENSKIWNLIAEYHSSQGEHLESLDALQKAYALDSEDPVIMRALAHKFTDMRMHTEALSLVNTIIEKTPNDPYARLLKSQLLTQSNQLDEAQQILQDISSKLSLLSDAQKNSNSSLAYVSGTAAFMQGNLEKAQKELTFYVNDRPDDLAGLNMLSTIFTQQGNLNRVEELLERNEKIVLRDLNLSLKLFRVYLASNKVFKAKNILEELAETYPNNLQIIIARSDYLAKSKRFEEAIELLNSYNPEKVTASYVLTKGLIYMEMGELENANKIADRLLELGPDNNSFKNFKGVIALRQKQLQKATSIFEDILSTSPNSYTSAFNLANALAQQNKRSEALEIVNQLVSRNHAQGELLLLKSKLERDTNDKERAIKTIELLLKDDSYNVAALELLMDLQYQSGDYDASLATIDKLNNIVFLEPKHLVYQANIYIKQGKLEQTERPLGILLGLAEQPGHFYEVSRLYADANNKTSAYNTIEKALLLEPKNQLYLLTQAKLAIDIHSSTSSKSLIDKLDAMFPNDPNVALLKGDYWFKQSKFKQAMKFYNIALSLDSRFEQAIAKLYFLANQGVGAESFAQNLEKLLANNQTSPLARNFLADFYLNSGQLDKAKPHYEKLLSLETANHINILNNLANIYLTSDLEKAKELIEQAISIAPSSPEYIDTLGWILSKQGDYKQALEKLRNAYALNSNNPSILYHLAYTLHKLGRNEEAAAELDKALSMRGNFIERQEAESLRDIISNT